MELPELNATHFRKSVYTGETLFFFGALPWPSSWTGYIVTSQEDMAKLNEHVNAYHRVKHLVLVPFLMMVAWAWKESRSIWPPDSRYVLEILAVVVLTGVVGVFVALLFKRIVLDPILGDCFVSQEKWSWHDVGDADASGGDGSAGYVLTTLLLIAGGLALLFWGDGPYDRMTGTALLVGAAGFAAWAVKTVRERRRIRERDAWRVR